MISCGIRTKYYLVSEIFLIFVINLHLTGFTIKSICLTIYIFFWSLTRQCRVRIRQSLSNFMNRTASARLRLQAAQPEDCKSCKLSQPVSFYTQIQANICRAQRQTSFKIKSDWKEKMVFFVCITLYLPFFVHVWVWSCRHAVTMYI